MQQPLCPMVPACSRARVVICMGSTAGGSKPTCEEQHDHDDQDDTEGADAAVSEAVAVTAEAATESAE